MLNRRSPGSFAIVAAVAVAAVLALAGCGRTPDPKERIALAVVILGMPDTASDTAPRVTAFNVRAAVFGGGGSVAQQGIEAVFGEGSVPAVWSEMSEGRVVVEDRGVHEVKVPLSEIAAAGRPCDRSAWRARTDAALVSAGVDPIETVVGYVVNGRPRCVMDEPGAFVWSWEAWLTSERPIRQQALAAFGIAIGFLQPFEGACATLMGKVVVMPETCRRVAGDRLSALGGEAGRYPSGGLVRRKWLSKELQLTVTKPGQYEVRVAGADEGPLVLTIPLGGTLELDVEYRRPGGHRGVELRVVDWLRLETCLIAFGEGSASSHALLTSEMTFTDPWIGVELTVLTVDADRAVVDVKAIPTASSAAKTGGGCIA